MIGLRVYDRGYTNTAAAATSRITYIDGPNGVLTYRGYPIEEYDEEYDEHKLDSIGVSDNDNNSINTNNELMSHHLYNHMGFKRGLIPKLMRKYLNIITLNCDISANVKLLSNLEKTFEVIANNLGIQTNDTTKVNSLLSQIIVFAHIHIAVLCNNSDEIK